MSNSEYISRDAVDTKLLAMEERFIDNPFALTAIAMAMNEIDKITAADVAPVVHGHWENKYERHYIFFGTCSVCKHVCQENNICGNCGAIMDESEENCNE